MTCTFQVEIIILKLSREEIQLATRGGQANWHWIVLDVVVEVQKGSLVGVRGQVKRRESVSGRKDLM